LATKKIPPAKPLKIWFACWNAGPQGKYIDGAFTEASKNTGLASGYTEPDMTSWIAGIDMDSSQRPFY
jgi:hypothetical protein